MRTRFLSVAMAVLVLAAAPASADSQYTAFAAVSHNDWKSPGLGIFAIDPSGNMNYWQLTGLVTSNLKGQTFGIGGCGSPCYYRSNQPATTLGTALNATPAIMPIDADNLFYAYVAPSNQNNDPFGGSSPYGGDSGAPGRIVLGSMLKPDGTAMLQSGQWMLGRLNDKPLDILPTTPSIGGAILPDNPSQPSLWQANVALLAYATSDKTLHLDAWWLPQRGNGVSPSGQSLATFTPSGAWDGNVSVAIRREARPDDTQADAPYGVYLVIRNGSAISLGYGSMGNLKAEQKNHVPTFRWTTLHPSDGISSPTASIVRGPDNRLLIYYMNGKGTLGSFLVEGTAAKPNVTQQAPIALPSAGTGTPSISFTLGDANQVPGPPNSQLTGVKVPVYRNVFYRETRDVFGGQYGAQPAALVSQYGYAMRDVLPAIPAAQQTLVGIIEGPPPVPNENIALGRVDTGSVGTTSYGVENSKSSGSSFSMEGGVMVSVSTEGGQMGGIDSEVDAKAGIGRTDMSESSTTSLATYKTVASIVEDKNTKQPTVSGYGIAFLYGATFTGYRYHFLDQNSQPIPGAASYTQVFATRPQVRPYNFDLVGGGPYPIPGQLMSYVVSQQQFDTLANSRNTMLGFQNPDSTSNFGIYYHWVEGGDYAEEANTLSTTTETKSWNVDVSAMMGYGMHGDVASWSVKAGDYLSINSESSVSQSTGTSISTDVDIPAVASGTAGVYTGYGYYTVPFKGSATYATELTGYLKAHDTPLNRQLLTAIVGDLSKPGTPIGEPWKIAYFIEPGDYFMIPASSGLKATGHAAAPPSSGGFASLTPPPPVPPLFAQMGITSMRDIGLLHIAADDLARKRVRKAKVDPIPAAIRQTAAKLSPDQVRQLNAYVAELQKATFDAYHQQHPDRAPRLLVAPHPTQGAGLHAVPQPAVMERREPQRIDFRALAQRGDMLQSKPFPVKAAGK